MPRITISLSPDQIAELEHLIEYTEERAVRRRAQIIVLLNAGYKPSYLAEELGISRNTVYHVAHNFELFGLDGLYDRPRSGRPRKFADEYRAQIETALAEDPAEFGYKVIGWTTELLREHLERTTHTSLSSNRLRDLLHQLGYEYRRQPPRIDALLSPRSDSQDINEWLRQKRALRRELPERLFKPYWGWAKRRSEPDGSR